MKETKAETCQQWKWMMEFCKKLGMSPTLGWEMAEKAWRDEFESKGPDEKP